MKTDMKRKLVFLLLAAVVLLGGLAIFWKLSDSRTGPRRWITAQYHTLRAVLASSQVKGYSHGNFTNIIFLHHSVGRNLINEGGLREALQKAGLDLWDQDYNFRGLRDPQGRNTGWGYEVPDENTNPDGLANLFAQPLLDQPWNAFTGLMQHEVIIFKSCYPASGILSDAQLAEYKQEYLQMRTVMDAHPDHLFFVLTPPPMNPAETNLEQAKRARAFARWLSSDEFLRGHANVMTFDLFDALAEPDSQAADANMLRAAYRVGSDSHPNAAGNQTVAPEMARFIIQSIEEYRKTYATLHPASSN